MRVLAVADYIEPLGCPMPPPDGEPAGPPVELVISCGDLPPEYLADLARCYGVPVLYVRGNHDIRRPEDSPPGCSDLHGRLVQVGAFRFAGLQGSHWYNGGPYQYTEGQMRLMAGALRRPIRQAGGLDVLIAHAPPRGVHDAEDPCHRGFRVFHRLIRRHQPGHFIHGHLHRRFDSPEERVTQVGATRVVNCAGHVFLDLEAPCA